jgi:hypothetical protein
MSEPKVYDFKSEPKVHGFKSEPKVYDYMYVIFYTRWCIFICFHSCNKWLTGRQAVGWLTHSQAAEQDMRIYIYIYIYIYQVTFSRVTIHAF